MAYEQPFPTQGGKEKLGRWVGRAKDYGDKMFYWILDEETKQLVVRSMVRSAADATIKNKHLDSLVKEVKDKEQKDQSLGTCSIDN